MKFQIKKLFYIFFLSIFISTNSFAQQKPDEFINEFAKQIFNIITNNENNLNRTTELLTLELKQNLDFEYICKFVIGRQWKTASNNFKKEFRKLFEEYLILIYAPKFKGYKGEEYKITKTEILRKNRFVSNLVVILEDKTQINTSIYFILNKENKYKIVDISAEGISFLATQKSEYASIIASVGLEEFLKRFNKKINTIKSKI